MGYLLCVCGVAHGFFVSRIDAGPLHKVMNHLDLFSGIGGFRLALDLCRVPVEHSYHSDIEPHANAIYAKNYPDSVPLGDVRGIDGRELRERHPERWLCSLGFPCQDISDGGKRKGLKGERSGLWFEALRVISELRPEIVFIENVAALRGRGLIDVLRGLDASGYDAEWTTLSAQEIGAIHKRNRIWITANLRDADCRCDRTDNAMSQGERNMGDGPEHHASTYAPLSRIDWKAAEAAGTFLGEPFVVRKANGLPTPLDIAHDTFREYFARNRALGNAIVPQCAAKVMSEFLNRAWELRPVSTAA